MTHSSKPSSYPYARFIPREEIDKVSSWRFDNVDGSPHPEDIKEPEVEVDPGPSPEAIAADMEALRRQSHQDGYVEGHAAGCAETRASLEEPARLATEAAARRFDEALLALQQDWAQTQTQLAHAVLEMACALARQVVRRELVLDPRSIAPVVQDALSVLVADTPSATVRLHPSDLAALEAEWTEPHGPHSPRWVADTDITPGGCVVEAPGAGVDATLEKRWQRAIANLGLDTAWNAPDAPDA